MIESANKKETTGTANSISGWATIFNLGLALGTAAITPIFAFFVFGSIFIAIALLIEVLRVNDFTLKSILSSIGGGSFLALYLGFYVPCFSFPCVAVFGAPAAIIAYRLNLIRWWTCVLAGFFLSSIPGGLFLWDSYSSGSSSANGVQYWINGVPTSAGLMQFILLVLVIGFLGILGGYSFWLMWCLLTQPKKSI